MGETAHILRVVVASPGDVQAERACLPTVIDEINRDIARDHGLRLELARWETDAYPGFHPEGPQGRIDPILRVDDCDVLIGIFWKRFGTPTMEAQSGTEHEFRRAYAAWQQCQRPHIMMYFKNKPYSPQHPDELDQWKQVLAFKQRFPTEGLWWPYNGKTQFERLVRRHLTQFLRHRQAPAAAAPPESAPAHTSSAASPPGLSPALRSAYLTWVMAQVRAVPLTGVDPKSIREETRRDLDLAAVYTALMTQRPASLEEHTMRSDRDVKRLSALGVLNAEARLALLGEPGSGKSTFVNFVALCLAGELLGRAEANLAVLRAPVPEEDSTRQADSAETPAPQPWNHGALLPIRVVLREFVARGLPPAGQPVEITSDTLWQFIVAELPEETLRDMASSLRTLLRTAGGLLLLDGLDEVPEADQRRVQVKAAIEQFVTVFPRVRVLARSDFAGWR